MKQEEEGKMFVGGVAQMTSAEKMQQYFSKYGEVIESTILIDKVTGNPRGFGFIKFKNPDSVMAVLKSRPHFLDDKEIDPKPCTPKDIQNQKKLAEKEHIQKYKIFIGGLTQNMTIDEVKAYFQKFGPTTEVVFALHKSTQLNKGFGFVTFEKESSASEAVQVHFHDIGGKRVEAKKAEPREKMRSFSQTVKQGGDNMMMQNHSNMNYGLSPNYGGSPMPWMGGYPMGPSGGYMPPTTVDSGYGTYGGYGTASSYGYNYGSSYTGNGSSAGSYSTISKQPQQTSYSNAKAPSRSSAPNSRSYHPYKR